MKNKYFRLNKDYFKFINKYKDKIKIKVFHTQIINQSN